MKKLWAQVQSFRLLLIETWRYLREADIQLLAGSLAFATVVSLVPLLAVSLSVFNAYGGFESLLQMLEPFILQNLAEATGAQVSRAIRKSIERVHNGALGSVGAVSLLFVSTKLFHDMETAVQRVWQLKNTRSLWRRLVVYWLIMFFGPLAVAVMLGLLGSRDLGLIDVLPKGAISITLAFVAFTAIYKLVPSCPVEWRSAFISAMIATIGIGLAQSFYSQITRNILNYNRIYGSLASIPIFLIWILVLWWICLAGIAFCAALERRRNPVLESVAENKSKS